MPANRSMAPGGVIPELGYADVTTAAQWLCRAFGFTVRLRIANHRVQLHAGTGSVIVVSGPPEPDGSAFATHSVVIAVDDIDAHFERARQAGATIVSTPTTFPYGERQYGAVDLGGHHWKFSQSVADVDPADWGGELLQP